MEAERSAWVKPAMVLMSPLSPGPQLTVAQADQEASAERRWSSEPVRLSLFLSGLLFALAKVVQLKSAALKWSSEPGLKRNGQGYQMSVLGARCGESGKESSCSGVGKDAGFGLGGSGDRAGRGGVCGGGERRWSTFTQCPSAT
jgi:hypothetical protein